MPTIYEQPYYFSKEFVVKKEKETMKSEYKFESYARAKSFGGGFYDVKTVLYYPCVVITSPFSSTAETLEFEVYFKQESVAFEVAKKLMGFEKEKMQKLIDNAVKEIGKSVREKLDQDIIDWFKNG